MIRILIISALMCSTVGYLVSALFSTTIKLISHFYPEYYGKNLPIILGMGIIIAISLGLIFSDLIKIVQTNIARHINSKKEFDDNIIHKYMDGYLYYIILIAWIVSTTLIPKIMVQVTYRALDWDDSRFSFGSMLVIAISIVGLKIIDGAFREARS